MKRIIAILASLVVVFVVVGCSTGGGTPNDQAKRQANENGKNFKPFVPDTPNTEQVNYNKAQELYNDQSTIIWCTVFPSSPAAPIVTVPVAGKLTSSSTTAFSPDAGVEIPGSDNGALGTARSVDGLYHPNPPPYRYGFTPGGQYVDFFNLETLCTTQPLKFQRENLAITPDAGLTNADAQAQQALKNGQPAQAQKILEAAAGGQ